MAGDIIVINHHQSNLAIKERTSAAGKTSQRAVITTTVTSEPIVFMLSEQAVAKRASEMFAQRIREQTESIVEPVKPGTAAARRTVEKAFAEGKLWAVKRYSGGRTGVTPPRAGENRAFNHSGRLARSIAARWQEAQKGFVINCAANRWQVKDFKSAAQMEIAFRKWVAHVPVLQDASSDMGIQRAIRETFDEVIQKQKMGTDHKSAMQAGKIATQALQKAAQISNSGGTSSEEEAA